jgi:RNA polymerase sigma-70 factor (ECF subfamily)
MEDLMRRIAAKDEAALEQLYRLMAPRIFAFAQRRLDDAASSDEVVSETLYEVWNHASRFRGDSQPSTWILGIARHKLLDKLRRKTGLEFQEMDEEVLNVADESPGMFAVLAERQQRAQVALCLDALPQVQRECLHLVFFEDLALADIAAIQGCPENTVKTRLFHARRKMRDCLKRQIERGGEPRGESLPERQIERPPHATD